MEQNSKKIRLGICMAGAVSAGAYTAGAVDYLIETLERWEQRKTQIKDKISQGLPLTPEEALVPMHDVVIEVLSGSSAGGMTAAVMSYSFNDGTYLNRRDNQIIEKNYDVPEDSDTPTKLYNAWINMVDEDHSTTFKKLMDPSDVVSFSKMKALLNSKPIDDIAAKAIPENINFRPPNFISEHLSIILSVTNLEGIPVDVSFTNVTDDDPTRNVLTTHSGFLHYKYIKEDKIDFDYPPVVITEKNKARLALAAKATGAFPFGLANRQIEIEREHFEKFKSSMKAKNMHVDLSLPENVNYMFTAVDGGALNNEPISITFKMLNQKKKDYHPQDDHLVILIDPFPTVTNASSVKTYQQPDAEGYSFKDQVFKLIGAFRSESSFKQEDLHLSKENKERYLISPAKKGFYFLACGLIGGFGGFMKKAFRKHDYQLGRKNCQTFLRYYLGKEPDQFTALTGMALSPDQMQQWQYDENYKKWGQANYKAQYKMPLIPDMLFLNKLQTDDFEVLNKETKAQLQRVRTEIAEPVYDGLSTKELDEIASSIKLRIAKVTDHSYGDIKAEAKSINKTLGRAMQWFPGFFKKKIVNAASSKIKPFLMETFLAQSIKQKILVKDYVEHIVKGGSYYKAKEVTAIVAKGGEKVVSFIDKVEEGKPKDGTEDIDTTKEDWNIAEAGDYIVTNGTRRWEQYIVRPDKFKERYELVKGNLYKPNDKARVYALKISASNIKKYRLSAFEKLVTNPMNPIYIESPWEQSQSLYLDDYLVTPLIKKDEVYGIKKNDFEDTYKQLK